MTITGTWKRNTVNRLRVIYDVNIILDVVQRREQHYALSAAALALAEKETVEGYIAAHNVTTLFYLQTRYTSAERARVVITELLQFLRIAAVDHDTVEQALNLPYRDFEDAVLMMAAVKCAADYVVTRDTNDFSSGPLPVLRPVELLALLS